MTNNTFAKIPLTQNEKEAKAEAFLNFEHKKEPAKVLYLRVPNSYWEDINKITALTGLSMNAVCLELLRPAIKNKLNEQS